MNITGSGFTKVLDPLVKTVTTGTADVSKLKAAIAEGNLSLK
jgi:hypothetical protein